jgi:hypothetical protein
MSSTGQGVKDGTNGSRITPTKRFLHKFIWYAIVENAKGD